MKRALSSYLIWIGSLGWIFSFFGESFLFQPYSTWGLFLSIPLLFVGVFFRLREDSGQFVAYFSRLFRGGGIPLREIRPFWVACIVIWIIVWSIAEFWLNSLQPCIAAKDYCKTSDEVRSRTGEVKYFGLATSGSVSSQEQDADLSLIIVGEKGNFRAHVKVAQSDSIWTVTGITFE